MAIEGRRHLLIVEDDADVRFLFEQFVKPLGIDVGTAATGVEALEWLETHDPELVLSDMVMPELDGLGLLREMRGRGNLTPLVFITGYGDYQKAIEGLRLGAIDFLEKPCTGEQLRAVVAKGMDIGAREKRMRTLIEQEAIDSYQRDERMITLLRDFNYSTQKRSG